jgi:hypothetical protein
MAAPVSIPNVLYPFKVRFATDTDDCLGLLFVADEFAGPLRREPMDWKRRLAALLVAFALSGCSPMEAGPGKVPNAPYPQDDTRDTSGMH